MGGSGAHLMEMQNSSSARSIQHDGSRFGCSHQAHALQQMAQGDAAEFPRRSKQLKLNTSKKIFPWMKKSRHSNQKHSRRLTGLYDKKRRQQLFSDEAFSFLRHLTSSHIVNGGNDLIFPPFRFKRSKNLFIKFSQECSRQE